MIPLQKAKQILEMKKTAEVFDTIEQQEKRRNWLNKLNEITLEFGSTKREKIPGMNSKYGNFDERLVYISGFKVMEIYDLGDCILKTNEESYSFFNPKHNTRLKINQETCCEIDKLDKEKALNIINEVILSLVRSKIHFAVFYAKGQRSPHIRIYDFDELNDLNPKQRIKAQILFWQRHVPFGCFQYIDTGMFVDEHPMQIEFSIHYRHKTPFNLVFEYPFQEVENEIN